MDSLLSHLRALQAGAAVSLTTAALIGLPLLAADNATVNGLTNEFYAQHIVTLFQKTGAESVGSFDNRSIDSSGFDFAAYMSNTCFRPTENDLDACTQEFGPYANLKETYDSGTLHTILKNVWFLAGAAQFAPAAIPSVSIETKPMEKSSEIIFVTPEEEEIRNRSVELWQICSRKEPTRETALRCYQRNIRRTADWSKGVIGNVY